jgi:hypothetical protein
MHGRAPSNTLENNERAGAADKVVKGDAIRGKKHMRTRCHVGRGHFAGDLDVKSIISKRKSEADI